MTDADYDDEWEAGFDETCDKAKREHDLPYMQAAIARLAKLSPLEYEIDRIPWAERLNMRASVLDDLVAKERPQDVDGDQQDDFALPHWNVQPWPSAVSGADLLNELTAIFRKYIFIPLAIADAAALWGVHAWTIDAGDISPFFVLVSPTKRCGKTSMLILLMYLTPRSELASNISPSALFRYVEHVHPTLLIDEADSFVGASEHWPH
jgi:hypothetical protein